MSQESPKATVNPPKVEDKPQNPEPPKPDVKNPDPPKEDKNAEPTDSADPKDVVGEPVPKKDAPPLPAPAPPNNEEGVLEAQMTKQETQDDAEIKAIKEKMTKLKDQ